MNWELSGEDYLAADQIEIAPESATAEIIGSFDVIRTDNEDGTVEFEITLTKVDSIEHLLIESIDSDGFDLGWSGTLDGEPAGGTLSLVAGDEDDTVIVSFAGDFEYATQIDEQALQSTVGISVAGLDEYSGELEPYESGADKKCVCFGKPELECTDEQCDYRERCPGGNGNPRCRWQFWVVS